MHADLARLLDLLLPGCCLHCGGRSRAPMPRGYLCDACTATLVAAGVVELGGVQQQPVHAALLLNGAARTLVHRLKYGGHSGVARLLALHMAPALEALQLPGCWLVPVPLHPLRRWRRGYDQAVLLARGLAHCVPGAHVLHALRRRRRTSPQVGLDGAARRRNLVGAFRLRGGQARLRRWPCVLVDDVVTTGATVNEAARLLRLHGAPPLAAIVAATVAANAARERGDGPWTG